MKGMYMLYSWYTMYVTMLFIYHVNDQVSINGLVLSQSRYWIDMSCQIYIRIYLGYDRCVKHQHGFTHPLNPKRIGPKPLLA